VSHRHVLGVSFTAFSLSLIFTISGFFLSIAIPFSLSFLLIGMLGVFVWTTLKNQSERIDRLEKLLEEQSNSGSNLADR